MQINSTKLVNLCRYYHNRAAKKLYSDVKLRICEKSEPKQHNYQDICIVAKKKYQVRLSKK